MKLILSNNKSGKFVSFYRELQSQYPGLFDYANYTSILFLMDTDMERPLRAINLAAGKELGEYDGVYINGYLNTYELAASTATACDVANVPFVNYELRNSASLSKLTSYAKLAGARVRLPRTVAGTKTALLQAGHYIDDALFPAVLKRADADRGLDNFKVSSKHELIDILDPHDDRSLWILQNYIPNRGFYLVSYYGEKPKFCIFRSLLERPDGDIRKSHMYKPKGGSNAELIPLDRLSDAIIRECNAALRVMNRQIGSVDCLYDETNHKAYILEVNYNPQLVTIETFKDLRIEAFVENLKSTWK